MSLALQIGSVLAFLVVMLPGYWAVSRLTLHTSAPTVWLRRLLLTFLPVTGGAYLLFSLVGIGELSRGIVTGLLSEAIPASTLPFFTTLAAQFGLFASTAAVMLTTYAAVIPAIRHARGIDVSTWRLIRRMGRYVAVLTILLTVFFVPFERVVSGEGGGLAPLTLALLLLVVPFVTPVLVRVLRSVRPPEQTERARLESLCKQVGLDVEAVWILTDAEETLEIYPRGRPGRRHLYISEFALARFNDETLGALLAANAGTLRHHYRAIKLAPLFVFLIVSVSTLTWGSPVLYAILIAIALLLPLPVLWAARRAVRRADDYAAAQTGSDTVANALERMATQQNIDIPSGRVTTVLKSRPPLQDRIDRLRNSTN